MPDLAEAMRSATEAIRKLIEALKPKTEQEYLEWLRYNDPLRYIWETRLARRKK